MNADELKTIAEALRLLATSLVLLGLIFLVVVYREQIGRKIDQITEFAYGSAKLSFAERVEILKRSARTGVVVTDEQIAAALRRADKHIGDLRGFRVLWVNDKPQEDRTLRDLLENYDVRSDVVRTSRDAVSRLEETTYDLLISDFTRPSDTIPLDDNQSNGIHAPPAGSAPASSGSDGAGPRLARYISGRSGVRVPIVLYSGRDIDPPPAGTRLATNRPDRLLNEVIDVAIQQASRVRAGVTQ
jgi:CheY-like chemotaxis protein